MTPDQAVSGQRFRIRVEAYDRYNNIVRNYNLSGNEVLLSTSGTSYITPSVILPTEFIDGVAVVEVMYDRAESFTISAKMLGDRRQLSKVTVSEEMHEETPRHMAVRKVAETAGQEKTPTAESTTEKKAEHKTEKKFEHRAEKHKAEKKEPVKQEARKAETEKALAAVKEEKKEKAREDLRKEKAEMHARKAAEEKREAPVKHEAAPATPKQPEPKHSAPKQVAKTAEHPKPVPETAKPAVREEKKAAKQETMTAVSKIAAIEARNKAMLVINLTDVQPQFAYSDSVTTRAGKEWLKLALKPAVRKTEKTFKFKSSFVGDVLVEEDQSGQNLLNIYIELLPAGVTFDIERIKNTLIVTLSKP